MLSPPTDAEVRHDFQANPFHQIVQISDVKRLSSFGVILEGGVFFKSALAKVGWY